MDWSSALKSTSYKQLKQVIPELENFFQFKCESLRVLAGQSRNQSLSKEREFIANQGLECLKRARVHLENGDVDVGWTHYYCAELLSFKLLENDELKAVAKQVLSDSEERLSEADKGVVRGLIGKANEGKWACKTNCNMQEVSAARKTVQKHNSTDYTQLSLAMKPLTTLIVSALVVIGIIIYSLVSHPTIATATSFSASGFNASIVNATDYNAVGFNATNVIATNVTFEPTTDQFLFLLAVACFGALGAIASGILTVSKDTMTGEIPKRLLSASIMIVKPVFGAIVGLAIYEFLISGLLQTLTGTPITNPLVFAVCFIAGFSEKFFLGAIEKADQSKAK